MIGGLKSCRKAIASPLHIDDLGFRCEFKTVLECDLKSLDQTWLVEGYDGLKTQVVSQSIDEVAERQTDFDHVRADHLGEVRVACRSID